MIVGGVRNVRFGSGQHHEVRAMTAPTKTKRKLTTILTADVVGYSQLMAADEENTFSTLRTYREVTDGLIEKHGGRIFNTAGDAVLAEFGSAVEAVRCAISIQEDLAVRNSELPKERQMWFRIGINVGDVMVQNGDLFGDGVNVAARLEGLAEKGGICISGSTFDQVKNKLSIAFDDIGGQKVKNIPEPVAAFRLVPGKVAVKPGGKSKESAFPGRRGAILMIAGLGVVAVLVAVSFFTGLHDFGTRSASPFDGHWKATVDSLSGCRDNNRRSFPVTIASGKIDMKNLRFPKTGSVAGDGTFKIVSTDRNGFEINSQTGSLSGNSGKGTFVGRRPTCRGVVTLERRE